jgi:hypothetical protein
MKSFFLIFIFSLSVYQSKTDPVERTAMLLKQANLAELAKTFAPSMELTVLKDENVYSREQAEVILNSFFSKNAAVSIKIIHRVDSNPDLRFAVAILTCKTGNFRTSFSLRNNNGVYQVNELRIEEERDK